MESVLHVEHIVRAIEPPMTIGFDTTIAYGQPAPSEDGEETFIPTIHSKLGSPLHSIDEGSKRDHVDLVRTVEYMPSSDVRIPHIFTETIHFLEDSFLIPIRTSIQTGPHRGTDFSHLPSLNYVRNKLTGSGRKVENYRPEVVSQLIMKDYFFEKNKRHPCKDWIQEDLIYELQQTPITDVYFDESHVLDTIQRFMSTVNRMSYEFNIDNAKDVFKVLNLDTSNLPSRFNSRDVISSSLYKYRNAHVEHPYDFRSTGKLPIKELEHIEVNSRDFFPFFVQIEKLLVTDCNVDVVVDQYDNVLDFRDNVVFNRFGRFATDGQNSFTNRELLGAILSPDYLKNLLFAFVNYHPSITRSIYEELQVSPVKFKFVKTNAHELLILLFRYNSSAEESALAGVYFDIALMSLAPISIMEDPIAS